MYRASHALLVPDNSSHAQDFARDSINTGINVSIGGTPVTRKTAIGRVVDDLHGHCQLSEHLDVGERGHVGMRPGVDGDITANAVVAVDELGRVVEDVGADKEMRCCLVVRLEEVVQLVGRLGE